MSEIKPIKIRELFDREFYIHAHSQDKKILSKRINITRRDYKRTDENGEWEFETINSCEQENEEPCVVAYCKNSLGIVFIIRSGKNGTGTRYYSFVHYFSSNFFGGFNTFRITEKEAIKVIKDCTNEKMIEDDLEKKVESLELVKELKR